MEKAKKDFVLKTGIRFGIGFWLASSFFKWLGMSGGNFDPKIFFPFSMTMLPLSLVLGFLMGLRLWNRIGGQVIQRDQDEKPRSFQKQIIMLFGFIFMLSGSYEIATKDLGPKWEGMVPSGGPQASVVGIITLLLGIWLVYISKTRT